MDRERSVDAIGELETEQIDVHVVEALRKRFADLPHWRAATPSPARK